MSDRRACMAYMMRECKSFPKDTSISKSLELYSQLLSIQFNTKQMAVLAATLANGGVCPLNKKAVFKMSDVRDCLSLMLSCFLIGVVATKVVQSKTFVFVLLFR
ncbi:hypothetical protein MHBO_004791 [Bonamia ostreae]|uniref:glutaminase n=1 Tax=Bonamia ostreae TaxID=126728 RepID=A0ABV2AUX6_9EUKA